MRMKFALVAANMLTSDDPRDAVDLARHAEATGFESIWTVEHVVFPEQYRSHYPYSPDSKMPGGYSTLMPDPLIWMSYLAAVTTTIQFATGILILPQRNPLVLAKEVATLDRLSGGRLQLGIGVGWLKEEFDALGVPFASRGRRTDEYIEIMRRLWSEDTVSFSGEFASFAAVSSNPKPARGAVPIVIGGESRAAAERAGRLGDGYFPAAGTPETLGEIFDIAHQTAAAAGRDPSKIELTASHPGIVGDDPLGAVEELAALGVHRAIVPIFFVMDPSLRDGMSAFGERVISRCS